MKNINKENVKGTLPYLDNITIGGDTEREHDKNVEFLKVVKKTK